MAVPLSPPVLHVGDVVFIGVDHAFWARAASKFSKHGFGHVGIAARDSTGRIVVVHAGGSPTEGDAPVLAVAEQEFTQEADRIAVYRPRASEEELSVAGKTALGFVRDHDRFDAAFSLDTVHDLYCSELVWRALSVALQRDIVPHKTIILGKPGVSLADLEDSALLAEVAEVRR